MSLTIGETIQQLHRSLRDYIEATYHISNASLVNQRRRLLDEVGVIHQQPYLESTPRYKVGRRFEAMGLDPAVVEVFLTVTEANQVGPTLIYNPPYQHQEQS